MDDDLKDQIESLLAIPNESMSTPVPWLARELLRRSLSALRQRDEALEAVLPLAQEMMVIARACGEGDDPFAAWETIFPAIGAEYGDGSLEDGEPDHPSIEQARAILTGSETNAR